MCCQPSSAAIMVLPTTTSTTTSCPTIKANARLRRSHRSWKDQQSANNDPLSVVNINNHSHDDDDRVKDKKNRRNRRRRPTTNTRKQQQQQQQQLVDCNDCDASAASTAPLSSDDSFSSDGTTTTVVVTTSMSSSTRQNKANNNNNRMTAKSHFAISTKKKRSKNNKNKSSSSSSSRPTAFVNIRVDEVTSNHTTTSCTPTPPPPLTLEEKSRYIALDAEMVGIGPYGSYSRLARIALIDYDGNTIYDTMVRVEEKVTDYRTFVSGITEADITSEHAVSFDVAQRTVRELIRDKIVVGHGLKNDFKVLGITSHPWYDIRDTAKYEPFMRVLVPDQSSSSSSVDYNHNSNTASSASSSSLLLLPKKLRILAKDKLGMDIQVEGVPHSPVEDALAALELYKRHRVKWEKAVAYKMERTREILSYTQQQQQQQQGM